MSTPTKSSKPQPPSTLSSAKLQLVGTEVDELSKVHTSIVRYPTAFGPQDVRVPRSQMLKPAEFERVLVDHGVVGVIDFAREGRHLYGSSAPVTHLTREAKWQVDRFINRYGEYGTLGPGELDTRFDRKAIRYMEPERSGRARNFLTSLDLLLVHSPILMMSLAAALVPALSMRLGTPVSFSVALTGESTTGKTRAAMLAQAVSTKAVDETYLTPLNMTIGVAGELGEFAGSLIAFKDPKSTQAKNKELAELIQTIIFSVSGGGTRLRLNTVPTLPPRGCIPFFTLEHPLASFLGEHLGVTHEMGDRVRVLEISVKPSIEGGIFEVGDFDAGELFNALEAALSDNYGTLLSVWINNLVLSGVNLKDVVKRHEHSFDVLIPSSNPFERRLLAHLRWIYVAAKMAVGPKYMPNSHEVIDDHFFSLARNALNILSGHDPAYDEDLKKALTRISDKRELPVASIGTEITLEEAPNGFRRKDNGVWHLYVRKEYFDSLLEEEHRTAVYRNLKAEGVLYKNKDGYPFPVSQSGLQRRKYLKFRFKKLRSFLE